jgi:hypothetical protein
MKVLYGLIVQLIATLAVVEVIGLLWSASQGTLRSSRDTTTR